MEARFAPLQEDTSLAGLPFRLACVVGAPGDLGMPTEEQLSTSYFHC